MRIYIHVPFCISKCYYCNFYSMNRFDLVPEYLAALKREFEIRSRAYGISRPEDLGFGVPGEKKGHLDSIYIGGGTPSALSADELDVLLGIFDAYAVGEYTVEMNPDTVTDDRVRVLLRHGVNRVSLGVQSTNDAVLKMIGRTHNFNTVERALKLLRQSGISNLSIDFITGFFGQTRQDADMFVRVAERYAVHVSVYSLEYGGSKIRVLEEEQERELFYYLLRKLEASGFYRYEISNFAKPGYVSQHNSAYWNGEAYLGLGPGASSFDGKKRVQNLPNLKKYIEGVWGSGVPTSEEVLTDYDRLVEDLILPLRTVKGISIDSFWKHHKIAPECLASVRGFLSEGLMHLDSQTNQLSLTDTGMDLSNAVFIKILEEIERNLV